MCDVSQFLSTLFSLSGSIHQRKNGADAVDLCRWGIQRIEWRWRLVLIRYGFDVFLRPLPRRTTIRRTPGIETKFCSMIPRILPSVNLVSLSAIIIVASRIAQNPCQRWLSEVFYLLQLLPALHHYSHCRWELNCHTIWTISSAPKQSTDKCQRTWMNKEL